MKKASLVFLIVAVWGWCASALSAQDWPALRGATGDGVGRATGENSGLFKSSGVTLKTRWKKKIGSGYSSVVIAGKKAITAFTSGDVDKLGCFNAETGDSIWEIKLDEKFPGENGSFDGPISTPVIHDGHVYALSCQGRFVCVTLEAGKLVWEKSLTKDYESKQPLYGFATSPIVAGNHLILQVGAKDKMLVAFDLESGEEQWATADDEINSQSPSLISISGSQFVLAAGGKKLTGVEPETGDVVFEFEHGAGNGSAMVPVNIGDDTVLLTTDDTKSKAVKLRTLDGQNMTASEAWQNRSIKNTYNVPTLCNGNVFAFSTRILTCVDPATGNARWKSRKPGDGFLIAVEDHIAIVTKKGSVHLATATADKFNEVAKLKVFEDLVWTIPSYGDGSLFVRSLGEIARVDIVPNKEAEAVASTQESLPMSTTFAAFIKEVEKAGDGAKKPIVDRFFADNKSFPIVDSGIAHFIYRGPEKDVAIACDALGARQERKMIQIDGVDLKYYTMQLESDQRLNYAFLVNFKPQTDKLNPRTMTSSMYAGEMEFAVRLSGEDPLQMSWFGMSDWKEPAYLKSLPEKLSGKLVDRTLEAEDEKQNLPLSVYLPPGYDESENRYQVVYVIPPPGMEFSKFVESADYLFANPAGGIRPAILVIPKGRLLPDSQGKLVEFIDSEFRTTANRNARSLVGFGFSGGAVFGALASRADLFGAASVQSPLAFSASSVFEPLEKIDQPVRIYMDWGRYDMHNPVENWDLRKTAEEIFKELKGNSKVELSGGMVNDSVDWASWRNRFDKVLSALTKER